MPKVIHFEPHGIKCDIPGCGWRDDSVVFDRRTYAAEWLNKPCPECSGNLYTERDFKLVKRMYRVVWWLNFCLGWVVWLKPNLHNVPGENITLQSDGRGFFTEAKTVPGGRWEKIIQAANARKALKKRGSMAITYTLTPDKRWGFVKTVLVMDAFPLRSRAELIWSALTTKDGKAKCLFRAPEVQIKTMMSMLQEGQAGAELEA